MDRMALSIPGGGLKPTSVATAPPQQAAATVGSDGDSAVASELSDGGYQL